MIFDNILFKPFGVDIFCLGKKFLVYNMVSRNLKIKYRRSILGVFWTLLNPIAIALVYYFVFKVIMKVQVPHYLAYVLSGVLPWSFFSQTLLEGMDSIVGSWGLVSKIPIPLQVFPYVNAMTNLSTLFISIPVLMGAAWVSDVHIGPPVVLILFYFFALFFITYLMSLVLSILYVYFRDLKHILSIFLQLWMYGTPVLYSENMIPEKYHWILFLNPIAKIFTGIHGVLVNAEWPPIRDVQVVSVWCVVIFVLSSLFQRFFGQALVEKI